MLEREKKSRKVYSNYCMIGGASDYSSVGEQLGTLPTDRLFMYILYVIFVTLIYRGICDEYIIYCFIFIYFIQVLGF